MDSSTRTTPTTPTQQQQQQQQQKQQRFIKFCAKLLDSYIATARGKGSKILIRKHSLQR